MQGIDREVSRKDSSIPTASDPAIGRANRSAQSHPINRARKARMQVRAGRDGGARFSQGSGNAAGVHGEERFAPGTKGNPTCRLHAFGNINGDLRQCPDTVPSARRSVGHGARKGPGIEPGQWIAEPRLGMPAQPRQAAHSAGQQSSLEA